MCHYSEMREFAKPGRPGPSKSQPYDGLAYQSCEGGMAMSISRRDLLFASGLSLLTSLRPFRPGAAPPPQQPQTPTTPQARLLAALQGNRLPLTMTDGPAGPGWDWLVQQARDARFTLIAELEANVPARARASFTRVKEASTNSAPFLFTQDPALVSAVRADWPNPDRDSDMILRTLEESLAINAVARTGTAWDSAQRRAQWMRKNLAERLREERGRGSPKVMMKFGYNHMIRGANYVNIFDLGTMPDEVAGLSGGRAFHILVLPGPGSRQAVLGPGRSFVSVSSEEFDEFRACDQRLTRVLSNAIATGHELIDLRALRPLAMRGLEAWHSDVVRTIHGYDAAVIWKGARASVS